MRTHSCCEFYLLSGVSEWIQSTYNIACLYIINNYVYKVPPNQYDGYNDTMLQIFIMI